MKAWGQQKMNLHTDTQAKQLMRNNWQVEIKDPLIKLGWKHVEQKVFHRGWRIQNKARIIN